jgi:hypothetical protein
MLVSTSVRCLDSRPPVCNGGACFPPPFVLRGQADTRALFVLAKSAVRPSTTPASDSSSANLDGLLHTGCGDIGNIAANGGTQAPEGDCNMPCSGDSAHICVSELCRLVSVLALFYISLAGRSAPKLVLQAKHDSLRLEYTRKHRLLRSE